MTEKQKLDGVVYTPPDVARTIVREAKFHEQSIPAICDPACGDGALLTEAARRLCKLPRPKAQAALRKLTGFDIDKSALKECKARLNREILPVMGSWKPEWNLKKLDILSGKARKYEATFTHIIGNPPYVRVQHLEKHRRSLIQKHWKLGRGATDLFIIFFEAGLELLQNGGRLTFITPSSWIRSQAGAALREHLIQTHAIQKIIDFGDRQMFKGVTTYTAITSISKKKTKKNTGKIRAITQNGETGYIQTGENPRSPWSILRRGTTEQLNEMKNKGTRLCEVADIRVGIQTLADKIFILPIGKSSRKDNLTPVITPEGEELLLENLMLRPIIKASVAKSGKDIRERVLIYPYSRKGKELTEKQLKEAAPLTHQWLRRNQNTLAQRDKGAINPKKWFLFGRRVSITTGFGEKILTSGINPKPNFQHSRNAEATFYSGYAIKPKKGISITKLLQSLNSPEMELWIKSTSRPMRNGWYSYAKSHIKDFPVQTRQITTTGKTWEAEKRTKDKKAVQKNLPLKR